MVSGEGVFVGLVLCVGCWLVAGVECVTNFARKQACNSAPLASSLPASQKRNSQHGSTRVAQAVACLHEAMWGARQVQGLVSYSLSALLEVEDSGLRVLMLGRGCSGRIRRADAIGPGWF